MSAMDELIAFVDDLSPVKGPRKGRPAKRQLCPTPVLSMTNKRSKHSVSTDDGIDSMSSVSCDPMNDSIAFSVKRRQRSAATKQFDSQFFYNSVVDQIERKYKKKAKDDAIIDLNDMQIVNKRGSIERRNVTEIGYFADNTLEELRQKSYKRFNNSPAVKSTSNANKETKQVMSSDKPLAKSTPKITNQLLKQKPKAKQLIESKKQLIPISKQLVPKSKRMVTNIEIAEESDDESVDSNESEESDDESVDSNESEESDDESVDSNESEESDDKSVDSNESEESDDESVDSNESEESDDESVDSNESEESDDKSVDSNESEESDDKSVDSNESEESDDESVDSNESEELGESHPLIRYEARNVWFDNNYQLDCLKNTIESLKRDKDHRFKTALHKRAIQALNQRGLPNGPNVTPIIKFNLKGEPNFEFFFSSSQSPADPQEVLQLDKQIIYLSKIIYECIQLNNSHYQRAKQLTYGKKQLQYK